MIKIFKTLTVVLFVFISIYTSAQNNFPALMPMPKSIQWENGDFKTDSSLCILVDIKKSKRVENALNSFINRVGKFTIQPKSFQKQAPAKRTITVDFEKVEDVKLGMDESYSLTVELNAILIKANTDIGIVRALETLWQLKNTNSSSFKCCKIDDSPRFQWRGLLIDVCRHFLDLETIKRNLDAMCAVKLNVLHFHLSEDQGFRIECKSFPNLHKNGSNGNYFTQEQIKEIINYADLRGIRVVPEFDLPGHSTSWFVSYPEFASEKKVYEIETKFGMFDPVFDPSNEKIYPFLETFFKEMCTLFPDQYMHIGGDENNGVQWNKNADIQAFIKKNNLENNHGLHAFFNKKLYAMLTKNGKKMIGWDEILSPDLPKDIMIQSWQGKEGMITAAKAGVPSILSNGYYIDLCQPAWSYYLNDPLDEKIDLTDEQKKLILGGEACMWSELVTMENVDGRIWPRTIAIAERLWSPAYVTDLGDMYSRMNAVSTLLVNCGLTHLKNPDIMLRKFTGKTNTQPIWRVLDMIEPVKYYFRHTIRTYYTSTPMNELPDILLPECPVASKLKVLNATYFKTKEKSYLVKEKELIQSHYIAIAPLVAADSTQNYLKPNVLLMQNLDKMSLLYMSILNQMISNSFDKSKIDELKKEIEVLRKPVNELEIGVTSALVELLDYVEKN
jgi:hexosaminidase